MKENTDFFEPFTPGVQPSLSTELARIALFEGIDGNALQELACGTRIVRYARGSAVFLAGDLATELYIVAEGCIKRTLVSADGNERVVAIVTTGEIFGEAEVFGMQRHGSMAIALETSRVICIDYTALRRSIKSNPILTLRMIEVFAERQMSCEADLAASLSNSVTDRVLDFLVRHSEKNAQCADAREKDMTVFLPASKKVIASRIGITPETFSRSLKELREAGLVTGAGKEIVLRIDRIAVRADQSVAAGVAPMGWSREARRHGPWSTRQANRDVSLKAINKAGLLRMLSQRLARSWLMIGCAVLPELSGDVLRRSAQLFERYLYDLSLLLTRNKAKSAHKELVSAWREYRKFLSDPPLKEKAKELLGVSGLVLSAAQCLVSCLELEMGTRAANFISVAGRQRMLVQRLSLLYFCRACDDESLNARDEIEAVCVEFSSSLEHLCITEERSESQVRSELDEVRKLWAELSTQLHGGKPYCETSSESVIVELSDAILERMDRAIVFYAAQAA